MKLFGIQILSPYCTDIKSIKDLCAIYQSSSRQDNLISINDVISAHSLKRDTKEIIERLSELALEFNSGNGNKTSSSDENIDPKYIISKTMSEGNESWIEFDCQCFYNFIGEDVSNSNVGKLLSHMQESICKTMENKRVEGSTNELQKVQTLKGRWFKVKTKNVENIHEGVDISRDDIYRIKDKFYRVLSVFKKSYNKWRLERSGKRNEKLKIHLQLLDEYHFAYNVHKKYKYICVNSKDIGVYIGHAF